QLVLRDAIRPVADPPDGGAGCRELRGGLTAAGLHRPAPLCRGRLPSQLSSPGGGPPGSPRPPSPRSPRSPSGPRSPLLPRPAPPSALPPAGGGRRPRGARRRPPAPPRAGGPAPRAPPARAGAEGPRGGGPPRHSLTIAGPRVRQLRRLLDGAGGDVGPAGSAA